GAWRRARGPDSGFGECAGQRAYARHGAAHCPFTALPECSAAYVTAIAPPAPARARGWPIRQYGEAAPSVRSADALPLNRHPSAATAASAEASLPRMALISSSRKRPMPAWRESPAPLFATSDLIRGPFRGPCL